MLRMISRAAKKKVYHKPGCPYISKIREDSKRTIDIRDRLYRDYRPCRYCGGIRGWARIFHKRPERRGKEHAIDCIYDDRSECLFLKTAVGFWKLYWQPQKQRFLLFHKNGELDPKRSIRQLMNENFHRQGDAGATADFDAMVNYIYSHDKTKAMAKKGLKNLPQRSKKQKKIYKHYAKKAKKDYYKRMDQLFEAIKIRK